MASANTYEKMTPYAQQEGKDRQSLEGVLVTESNYYKASHSSIIYQVIANL